MASPQVWVIRASVHLVYWVTLINQPEKDAKHSPFFKLSLSNSFFMPLPFCYSAIAFFVIAPNDSYVPQY